MSDFGGSLDRKIYHPFLNRRVRVRLDQDVWIEGIMLCLTESGDVDLREDNGRMIYAWPVLEIEGAVQR